MVLGLSLITFLFFPAVCYGGLNFDVDLGVRMDIGDDDLYLRINAHHYDRDPEYVRTIIRRHNISDRDYPVVLFLAHHSGRDSGAIISLRRQGLSWWNISLTIGVPVSVYFMDLDYRPSGPPYGKAYGYWKKHKKNPKYHFILSDVEVFDLISLKMTSHFYKMKPKDVIQLRKSGVKFKHIVTDQYRKHHKPPGQMKNKNKAKKPGKGNKKGTKVAKKK
jgi:hypothetical protein